MRMIQVLYNEVTKEVTRHCEIIPLGDYVIEMTCSLHHSLLQKDYDP